MADTHSVIGTKNKKGQTFTDTWKMMNEAPRTPSFYTGSEVIKEALRRASCDVMIAYPITPQSEAAALIGELFAAIRAFDDGDERHAHLHGGEKMTGSVQ